MRNNRFAIQLLFTNRLQPATIFGRWPKTRLTESIPATIRETQVSSAKAIVGTNSIGHAVAEDQWRAALFIFYRDWPSGPRARPLSARWAEQEVALALSRGQWYLKYWLASLKLGRVLQTADCRLDIILQSKRSLIAFNLCCWTRSCSNAFTPNCQDIYR